MKIMKKIITIFMVMAAALSCAKEIKVNPTEPSTGILATAEDFCASTKTVISDNMSFSWAAGDVIGVVPMDKKTFQTNFEIKTIGSDPKTASFDGGAWGLKPEKEYAAYYPCKSMILTSEGSARVSFMSQMQTANNDRSHLGEYDYMYASAVAPTEGMTCFNFKHKVSILRVSVPMMVSGIYNKLTLSATDAVFARSADFLIENGTLTGLDFAKEMTLDLNDLTLNEGETLLAWLIVLPSAQANGQTLAVTMTTDEGLSFAYEVKSPAPAFEQGKAYKIEASAPEVRDPLCCEWSLTADQMDLYKDLFGGTDGVVSQQVGFGFLSDGETYFHVPSTNKVGGNIYYSQVDKTGMTPTSGNPKRIIGGTGDAYVTGAWPGDYWLITATDGFEYPAGTSVKVSYLTRVSGTGHKYQILEYWDGQAWQPTSELLTETETGKNAKYNFIETTSNQEVNVTFSLAVPCKLMQFRMRCAANWQQNGTGALDNPNGGTIRISERCKMQVIQ